MRSRPRGRVVTAVGFAATAALLAACSSGSTTPTPAASGIGKDHAPTTLTYWTAWAGDDAKEYQQIVDKCTKDYPWMTVKVVSKPDGIGQATLAAVTAGKPPDVVEWRDAESLGAAASQEVLIPIDPFVERDGLKWTDFAPGAEKMSNFNGSHYTLPYAFDVYGLYYNKDLLAKAGFTEPPTTLDEIGQINDKLTVKNSDGSIKSLGFLPDYFGSYMTVFGPLFGGTSYDQTGLKATVTSTEGWQKAMEWQQGFYDKYGYDSLQKFKASFGEYDSARHPFLDGKVAMVFEGEWLARYPELFGNGNPKNWGFAPMPGPNGIDSAAPFTGLSGNSFALPRGGKNPEEAWTLAKCMATDVEGQAKFNDYVRNIPALLAASQASALRDDPNWQSILDLAASAGALAPATSIIGDPVAEAMGQLEEKYVAGKVDDLSGGLNTLESQVQSQIDSQAGP